jgi:hypothetical protein
LLRKPSQLFAQIHQRGTKRIEELQIEGASCKKSEPSEQIDSSAHEQAIFDDNRYSPVTVLPLKHKVVGF